MPLIQASNISKSFLAPKGKTVDAVNDVSLHVEQGEILGLLGPNGAGKTTFLRILGTLISPTSGECYLNGKCMAEDPESARRDIGFLSGNTKLYGRLTVREMMRYFGRLYQLDEEHITQRTDELAHLLDMTEFVDRRCETLSTGQTQKASIARVILHDPKLLILDEPTLGLDIMTARTIMDFIDSARDRGHSIIFSTHYMTEAEMLCDRIALMHKGCTMMTDTQEVIYSATGTSNLQAAFLSMVDEAAETSA
jgi:sodium transport system ATP-binding protein